MSRAVPEELISFLAPYPRQVVEIMLATREVVWALCPNATETIWDACSTVTLGPTYTHSHMQGFLYVAATKDHVNLGLCDAAHLDDPEGRIEGTGNKWRHVKLRSPDDADDPYIQDLIRQVDARAYRPDPPLEAKVIIRVMQGRHRRPS
jgi:hypothetical protein